ncbi:hypothetical protein [Riemerella anatipestifer]|uniref:hypothetical protein n=1 Tax=Riemerella anatipestifer TaxID=34085 RepID=UPI0030ECE4D8
MKRYTVFIILLLVFSCRKEDAEVQYIDQTIDIFLKDTSGRDLLNTNTSQNRASFTLSDLGGEYSSVNLSSGFSRKMGVDSIYYIQYISGATRNLKDSVSPSLKYYQSDIAFNWQRKLTDSTSSLEIDTMRVIYSWQPSLFQVKEIFWNNNQVFSKQSQTSNVITIVK